MVKLLALLALAASSGCGSGEEAAAAPARATTTVLVELFTSQGCSSCPPADRLLGQLPAAAAEAGVLLLPLAFHVDYWDRLGWRDRFSSAEWTARQQRYADALAGGRVYTPQLVVQGAVDLVGSDRGAALAAISRAASARGARISAALSGRDRLTVAVDAGLTGTTRTAEAWVALVENGLATDVAAGENRGRNLTDNFVVRRLVRAFRIDAGRSRRAAVELAVDPSWRRDRLGVTVFLQDPDSLAVLAAARAVRPTSERSAPP